jgi:hypothetical protein
VERVEYSHIGKFKFVTLGNTLCVGPKSYYEILMKSELKGITTNVQSQRGAAM